MHEHNHCKHKLEYCKVCDVVYCSECLKEWGTRKYYYQGYPYWVYTGDGYKTTITVADSHVHNIGG